MALKTSNKNRKKEQKKETDSKIVKSKVAKLEFMMNPWMYVAIAVAVLIGAAVLS